MNGGGSQRQVLLVECPDRRGLVHAITGVLLRHDCNVTRNHEFVDSDANRFFMRTEFTGHVDGERIVAETTSFLPDGGVTRLASPGKRRVVVLVSREHHCLADLLVRNAFGELNSNILAVVSNHEALRSLVEKFELPFHFVPAENQSRDEHEAEVVRIVAQYDPDWLVLAKYMRVLTPEFVQKFPRRIVNIHHSFLPAFIGAKPYQQAFQRGVKVIGATAHFVTDDLDQGPIIVQQVIPVDHTHSASDMTQAGRDVEKIVLAHALELVFEDRVFLSGNRTIIFD
ncbi:MAG TPA: formyltetrahydrofolate deformylase [Candidatus Acidoferrum sp.]|nr:formyltetrahydrofolate deformylase [Candidatus Acidoferrum sp.]